MNTALGYLGNIPDGWNLVHLGRLTSEVRTLNSNCSETNALQFKMGNIISKSTGDSKYHPETLEGYTIVTPGDVVVNGLNLNYDLKSLRVGQVRENGVITSAYIIVRPEKIDADYFKYLLKGFDSIKTFHGMGKGIRLTLGYEELRRMYIPVPSPLEQSRIAAFLDERCGKIDEAIAKHKALIEKLDEYRKAVITAIMKFCNSDTRKLKFCVKLCTEKANDKDNYIALENIESQTGRYIGNKVFPDGEAVATKQGYVLFGKLRPYLAKCYVTEQDGCCSGEFLVMDCYKVSARFLQYVLLEQNLVDKINMSTYGTKMPRANWDFIRNQLIPVPSPNEQSEIVAYLDEKCAAIDSAKERHAQLIAKLEEYKKSLIFNAVTGKFEC